jgi:hypothetical protein
MKSMSARGEVDPLIEKSGLVDSIMVGMRDASDTLRRSFENIRRSFDSSSSTKETKETYTYVSEK